MRDLPKISGYEVRNKIGEGGLATVYLAIQERSKQKVAIKILKPRLMEERHRFLREVKIVASLKHYNIVSIYDTGKVDNYFFMVMEYLEETLKHRLKLNRIIDPDDAMEILKPIIDALDYTHASGISHRDIKPGNIMFRKGGIPVLLDFDLARAINKVTMNLTNAGILAGTFHYMSPEQCNGERGDSQCDFYSLGVVLFEMLTGTLPYQSKTAAGLLHMHVYSPIPQLPKELILYQPLIDKMMAKNKEERLSNGKEFEQILDDILRSQTSHLQKETSFTNKLFAKLRIGKERSNERDELKQIEKKLGKRFEILNFIESDSIYRIYKIRDRKFGRNYVLKIFHNRLCVNEDTISRFKIEAQAYAKCRHPNLITLYDMLGNSNNGLPCLIMEYIEGTTLKNIFSEKRKLELTEVIAISQGILNGLGYMHQRGLIHNCLNPGKIMVKNRSGRVMLIYASIDNDIIADLEAPSSIYYGFIEYISPEKFQIVDGISPQTDIYSFGIILYEMLVGELPFERLDVSAVINFHLHSDIPNVREKNPDLPEGIENIIYKSTAKDPKYRYQNTQELLHDLQNVLKEKDIGKESKILEIPFEADSDGMGVSNSYLEPEINLADLENKLRAAVLNKSYPEGKQYLRKILNFSSERTEQLKNEFGFIYNLDNPEYDETNWKKKKPKSHGGEICGRLCQPIILLN